MNIVFRDGGYIPIDREIELPNSVNYNSIIGRYQIQFRDAGLVIIPKISPVLFLTRDLYWSGDHFLIYQGDDVLLNLGAKIYNRTDINMENADFRLNDTELDSNNPSYSMFEIYNIDVKQNSIVSATISEHIYNAEVKNIIYDSIHNPTPVCYRSITFKPDVSIPRGIVTIMGFIERNITISTIDSTIMDQETYVKIYENPVIRSSLKVNETDNIKSITMILENNSDVNQELSIILDLNTSIPVDYEGDLEYRNGKLFRDIILSSRSKKELTASIVF
ncbi:MAG: hypothetical protein NZ908_02255 [Candidatus Micrarchaeota archaeon]|nr:hypothetical protein [Candidatus Micrarchaeota archaeon]MCX8154517.1 hypothetical protein [Candidatus Micrarchaeota archaeon]